MYRWLMAILLCELPILLAQLSTNPEELLNWCINGTYHKSKPGPEDILHNTCLPWKDRSCCTHSTTEQIHNGQMYNLNFDHCGKMSEQCKNHFFHDLCFYECEPNLGPWAVEVNMKFRKHRVYKVPLCSDDCDTWFDACKSDSTCAENWITGLKSKNGIAQCRNVSDCDTIENIFKNSSNFCEKVWDHSWRYTPSDEPCMRMWFDSSSGNPNERVAKLHVEELQAVWGAAAGPLSQTVVAMVLTIIVTLLVCH